MMSVSDLFKNWVRSFVITVGLGVGFVRMELLFLEFGKTKQ